MYSGHTWSHLFALIYTRGAEIGVTVGKEGQVDCTGQFSSLLWILLVMLCVLRNSAVPWDYYHMITLPVVMVNMW